MKIIFVVNIHIFQILKSSTCVFKQNKAEILFIDFLDRLALVNCVRLLYSTENSPKFVMEVAAGSDPSISKKKFFSLFSLSHIHNLNVHNKYRVFHQKKWKSDSNHHKLLIRKIFSLTAQSTIPVHVGGDADINPEKPHYIPTL